MTKFVAMTQAKPNDSPKSPKDKAKKGYVLSCCVAMTREDTREETVN